MDISSLRTRQAFLSPRSKEIFEQANTCIIGVSPFNGYYTRETITQLLTWSKGQFKRTLIFYPKALSHFTLQAAGYTQKDAIKKESAQDKYLYNKITDAVMSAGLSERKIIITPNDFINNDTYLKKLAVLYKLYYSDAAFMEICNKASTEAISTVFNRRNHTSTKGSVALAAKYILAELPFLLNGNELLSTNTSLFIYHRIPDFMTRLLSFGHPTLFSTNHGFASI